MNNEPINTALAEKINSIYDQLYINSCKVAAVTALAVSAILYFLGASFHDIVVIIITGTYYLALLLGYKFFSPLKKYFAELIIYGAMPIIFYALQDEALKFMTPAFLFFLPLLAFFGLGKKKGLYAVALYTAGVITIFFYIDVKNSLYNFEESIFNIVGLIFISFIGYIITGARDKTELLYTDERRRYENYKLAVSQATNHIILTDINGQIMFANEAAQNITGYTFSEMQGNTPRLWGGLQTPEFYADLWKTIKVDKKKFSGTIQNRRKNGELYTAIAHIAPILDVENELIGFIGSEEDITKITELESKLAQDKKRDETLLYLLGEGVVVQNKDNKVILINKAAQDMLQYKNQELLGKSFVEIVHAESPDGKTISPLERPLALIGKSKNILKTQLTYLRKDGTKFESELIITPVYIDDVYFGDIQVFKDISKEKQIDRMKTEFISLASHQLRTPLSAMKWFSEMLLAGDAGNLNSEQHEFIQNISDSNDRMIDLVNSLLNISRIESGRILIDPRPTDLQELVREIIDELKKKSSDKNIKIIMSAHENLPRINCDPKMMRQVYINLLTNAIKYTKPGGEIQIFISKKDNEIISQVSDNGMGIPKAEQSKIFQRFFRASNIVKTKTDGTGLGLYLAKAIMESSGGKIWFESEEGKGTAFFISLPIEGSKPKRGEVSLNS